MSTPDDDDEARYLVADLAARGGDAGAVRALLLALVDEHPDRTELLTLTLTALAVTFSECLPHPVTTPAGSTPPPAPSDRSTTP
jgi:hypothetical protein